MLMSEQKAQAIKRLRTLIDKLEGTPKYKTDKEKKPLKLQNAS